MKKEEFDRMIAESVQRFVLAEKKKSDKKKKKASKNDEKEDEKKKDTSRYEKIGNSFVTRNDYKDENGFIVHADRDYGDYNSEDRRGVLNTLNNPALNLNGLWKEYIGSKNMSEELLQKIAAGEREPYEDSVKVIKNALTKFINDIS